MKRWVVAVLAAVLGVAGLAALTATTSSAAAAAPTVPTQWKSVSAAGDTTCAIDTAQGLWCWGYNYYGEVGNGTNEDQSTPVKLGTSTWLAVRTSPSTTCGIKTDRSAWCWGYGSYGTLGNNDTEGKSTNVPTRVFGTAKWAKVSPGYYNSCGISTAGALYCWGFDGDGGIGDGANTEDSPSYVYKPKRVGTATNWGSVSLGYYNTCGLQSTGKASCWGYGYYGSNGDGSQEDVFAPKALPGTWKNVNNLAETVCGVTTNSVSKCWGYNSDGQTGAGNSDTTYVLTPTALATGSASFARVLPGWEYTCGVRSSDAGIRCFGDNSSYGQFGNGTYDDSYTPVVAAGAKTAWTAVSIGDYHACGIRNGGKLLCWGGNYSGQIGVGTSSNSYDTPVQVGSTSPAPTSPTTSSAEGRGDRSAHHRPTPLTR